MASPDQIAKQMDENAKKGAEAMSQAIEAVKVAHGLGEAQDKRPQLRLLQNMKADGKYRDSILSSIVGMYNRNYRKQDIARILGVSSATLQKVWREYAIDTKVLARNMIKAGVTTSMTEEVVETFEGALRHLANLALHAESDTAKIAAVAKLVDLAALRKQQNKEGLPEHKLVMEVEKPSDQVAPDATSPQEPVLPPSNKAPSPETKAPEPKPVAVDPVPAPVPLEAKPPCPGESNISFQLKVDPKAKPFDEREF